MIILKITGKHVCNSSFNDCNYEYNWEAQISQHVSSSSFEVELIDENKAQASIKSSDDGEFYEVKTICPRCYQDNLFRYPKSLN